MAGDYNAATMKHSRRSFAALVGAMASAPLWDTAVVEAQSPGGVSAETVRALLDVQGGRSIFDDPQRFEELRAAVGRAARNVAALRAFPVSDDVLPAVMFSRQ